MSAGIPTSSGGGAPSTNQPHQTDTDPLVKYQTLLPILKESVNVSDLGTFCHTHAHLYEDNSWKILDIAS